MSAREKGSSFISSSKIKPKDYNIALIVSALGVLLGLNFFFLSHQYHLGNFLDIYVLAKREFMRSKIEVRGLPLNVLVFGDSSVASGFNPDTFDAASGGRFRSANMGVVSHDIVKYGYFLEDYLAVNPPPALVIVNPSYPRKYELCQSAGVAEAFHMWWATKESAIFFDCAFPVFTRFKNISPQIIRVGSAIAEFNDSERQYQRRFVKMSDRRGSFWWGGREQALNANFVDKDDRPQELFDIYAKSLESHEYLQATRRFFRLLEQYNIRSVLVNYPRRENSGAQYPDTPDYFKWIQSEFKWVQTTPVLSRSMFYSPIYFFNRGHLNEEGSKVYSKDIFTEVEKLCVADPGFCGNESVAH